MPLVHRRKAAATAGLLLSIPAGAAELLITREWAILAGENDHTTGTFQQITGRPPRPVAEFLHDYRAEFVGCLARSARAVQGAPTRCLYRERPARLLG
jgi:hypothetical protein